MHLAARQSRVWATTTLRSSQRSRPNSTGFPLRTPPSLPTSRWKNWLADILIADAPQPLDKVYFVSGGSEAVEAALKMARQYFLKKGEPQRCHLIARRQSYYGNTLGALATGGNFWRRKQFTPLLIEVDHIAPCYAYRHQLPDEDLEAYGQRAANELEEQILRLGPDQVIAFIAETIVGATLGAVPAAPGYYKRIRDIGDRYGVLLILDEVMCGSRRTGSFYACMQDGVVPDLLCMAKGLAAGYQPIGAVLAAKHIYEAIVSGSGFFQHGHTYMGHATACSAALAVQRAVRSRNLLPRISALGDGLVARLHQRFDNNPHIGDIRGRGLFRGLELVADRESKEPFNPKLQLHARIKTHAMAAGLICYPMGGTIDGTYGDHVLLAPPYILEETHLDELVEKLGRAIDGAIAEAQTL